MNTNFVQVGEITDKPSVTVSIAGTTDGSWDFSYEQPYTVDYWTYPLTPYQPFVPYTPPTTTVWVDRDRKIQMTLADVEALKRAADADEDVRAALQKLAPHIDVDVEF